MEPTDLERLAREGDEKSLLELANPCKEDNIEAQKYLFNYYGEKGGYYDTKGGELLSRLYLQADYFYHLDDYEQEGKKKSAYWRRMAYYWLRIAEGSNFGYYGDDVYEKWLSEQKFPREAEHYAKRQFSGWLENNNNETGFKFEYEPNGNDTLPDYKLTLADGKRYAVEITRLYPGDWHSVFGNESGDECGFAEEEDLPEIFLNLLKTKEEKFAQRNIESNKRILLFVSEHPHSKRENTLDDLRKVLEKEPKALCFHTILLLNNCPNCIIAFRSGFLCKEKE